MVEMTDYPERFTATDEAAATLRERVAEATGERWRLVEAEVAGPYLLASGFSAADLYVTKLAVWVDEGFRRAELPRIQALVETVRARPQLAGVWARHIPR